MFKSILVISDLHIPYHHKDSFKFLKAIKKEYLSYFHHQNGFDVDVFEANTNLMDFYHILTNNKDLEGREFVSTIEAKEYPFYGV